VYVAIAGEVVYCVILPNFQTSGLVKDKHPKFDYTDETKKTQIFS